MNLEAIKGHYDAIFSLGDLCLTSLQLKDNNLRTFSGILDWVSSPSLKNVNVLLQNRFADFLNLKNLRIIKYISEWDLLVWDEVYNIGFNHDFKTDKNTLTHLGGYAEVKEKYDRRIQRFLEKLSTSQRILFIRTEASFEEVAELEAILSGMIANDFRILIVNHTDVDHLVEKSWPLQRVCAIELPNHDKWNANNHYWKMILDDITLL
ncbi:papain-like cysteine peptidase (plasmid) [Bacillus sp. PK9-021]|uniref:DUF1796 family putative cysteine peptidase n=1 Tax=Priestia megaterium TaxID=1404 RepID=UPI002452D553|nr:DUF1796 family putative cysteine peptidase [Priestia megaterium]MDH3155868.1 DUF1796 family putative cysteine peptidase [Priestia megaterium]MED4116853.1 DUF1796 family putative cysteine peptidase [Priestia megaterium]